MSAGISTAVTLRSRVRVQRRKGARMPGDVSSNLPAAVLGWLRRPFDRCRIDGRRIFTKHGCDLCRRHGYRQEWKP